MYVHFNIQRENYSIPYEYGLTQHECLLRLYPQNRNKVTQGQKHVVNRANILTPSNSQKCVWFNREKTQIEADCFGKVQNMDPWSMDLLTALHKNKIKRTMKEVN